MRRRSCSSWTSAASSARPTPAPATACAWACRCATGRGGEAAGPRCHLGGRVGRAGGRPGARDRLPGNGRGDPLLSGNGEPVWTPSPADVEAARISAYAGWLAERVDREFPDYQSLWEWSVERPDDFWRSIWDYFGVIHSGEAGAVTDGTPMPATRWFEGTSLNYAEHVFRNRDPDRVAIYAAAEDRPVEQVTWADLEARVAAAAEGLKGLGVTAGDRVVAYLPNSVETVVAFLASASIGAVWSSCSPEFGIGAVRDRFAQIEPIVLIATDRYRYGGREFDRRAEIAEIAASIVSRSRSSPTRMMSGSSRTACFIATWKSMTSCPISR